MVGVTSLLLSLMKPMPTNVLILQVHTHQIHGNFSCQHLNLIFVTILAKVTHHTHSLSIQNSVRQGGLVLLLKGLLLQEVPL